MSMLDTKNETYMCIAGVLQTKEIKPSQLQARFSRWCQLLGQPASKATYSNHDSFFIHY
jgi:hypothetical protein